MSDSSDEEHPYVQYGTPLPDLDEHTIKSSTLKSNVPVFEQVVTDEQGRRRFHGAFTGGFSAGYYNSVGTKEGWKPSTFKSSRLKKSDKMVFTAEDFMDEEDMGDFGIAPKTLSTKEEFTAGKKRNALEEKQKKVREGNLTFSLGSGVMDSLVVPVRSTVGIKLLRSMGWRDGQGLGPHVVKKKKKVLKKKPPTSKVYGCSLPNEAHDSNSDDENIPEDFKFAPKDLMPISVSVKDDLHGIGYRGLDPTAALHKKVKKSSAIKGKTKAGSKLSFFGQAFGVGAYEEEDDDVYAQDSMSNYDAIMSVEQNPDDTYGWTKPLAISGGNKMEAIAFGEINKIVFVPAKKQTKLFPKVYPPPTLPPNFDPHRRLRLKEETQRINAMNLPKQALSQVLPAAPKTSGHLTSEDRQLLLSDVKAGDLQNTPQSVFDFISAEDRQKMEAAKRKPVELGHKGNAEPLPKEIEIDRSAPLCNPRSLKPFSNNPGKMKRYEQYEEAVKLRKKDPYSFVQSNLTEWEKKHERDEFARISQVYLHLTTSMNSRFTKTSLDDQQESNDTNLKSASKMKMFGVMTHSNAEWHPDPLLCKRFNVPDPYPDSEHVGSSMPSGSKYLSFLPLANVQQNVPDTENDKVKELKNKSGVISDTVRPPTFEKSKPLSSNRWDKEPDFVGPLGKKSDSDDSKSSEDENTDHFEQHSDKASERPPMALFKSIFASSEEESSSSDDEDDVKAPTTVIKPKPVAASEERISAADIFMKPIPIVQKEETVPQEPAETDSADPASGGLEINKSPENSPEDDNYFGPALPPVKSITSHMFSTEDGAKPHKSHSKHKKNKKRDHKSKKKKHRKD